MKPFDITGPITEIPENLAGLDDSDIVPFVIRPLIGQPCVIGYPAETIKRIYAEAVERHRQEKYSGIEIAFMLAEQQKSLSPGIFVERVVAAYKRNMLRFYEPDGSPCPQYVEGESDPYCRSLEGAHTTPKEVNVWLEEWGAMYRFVVASCEEIHKTDEIPHGRKQEAQKKRILEAIKELGYDPQRLPSREGGKRGVKAIVWEKLQKEVELFGSTKNPFDTAWKELNRNGEIRQSG